MKKKFKSDFRFDTCFLLGQTITENFVKSTTYKQFRSKAITNSTTSQAKVEITYFDGLGRTTQ